MKVLVSYKKLKTTSDYGDAISLTLTACSYNSGEIDRIQESYQKVIGDLLIMDVKDDFVESLINSLENNADELAKKTDPIMQGG